MGLGGLVARFSQITNKVVHRIRWDAPLFAEAVLVVVSWGVDLGGNRRQQAVGSTCSAHLCRKLCADGLDELAVGDRSKPDWSCGQQAIASADGAAVGYCGGIVAELVSTCQAVFAVVDESKVFEEAVGRRRSVVEFEIGSGVVPRDVRTDRLGGHIVARGGSNQRGQQGSKPHLGVVVGVLGHRTVFSDAALFVRATQRRSVGGGDTDQVAGARKRRVDEGDRRSERIEVDDIEHRLVEKGVDVPLCGRAVEVVAREILAGEVDGLAVDITARHLVALVCGPDAPDAGGRHRVEIRRHAGFALLVSPEDGDRDIPVEFHCRIEKDAVAAALAGAVTRLVDLDCQPAFREFHTERRPTQRKKDATRTEPVLTAV